jgi:parallel beta-helix repeat protein
MSFKEHISSRTMGILMRNTAKFISCALLIFLISSYLLPADTLPLQKPDDQTLEQRIQGFYKGITYYVGGSGPGNYSTIQDAIDASSDGDIIYVYPGTYYEEIHIEKSIFVTGENRYTTIIDAQGIDHAITIDTIAVTLTDFTIQQGDYYGILLDNAHGTIIQSNIIQSNGDAGIYAISAINCSIYNNSIQSNTIGISLDHNTRGCTIKNNIITDHTIRGIYIRYSYDNSISSTFLSQNNIGISIHYSSNITVTNCTLNDQDSYGIRLKDSSYSHIQYNQISNVPEGIVLFENCTLNSIIGNTIRTSSNQPPTACNDTASTQMDTEVYIDVSSNDHDRDGMINPLSVQIQTYPFFGVATVNLSDGVIRYIPNSGYNGTDSFTYTIRDTNATISNIATVLIEIIPDNLDEEISQQQNISNRSLSIYSGYQMVQTFRMTGTLTRIELYLSTKGTPADDLAMALFEENMSNPPITTMTYPPTLFNSTYQWTTFDMVDYDIDPTKHYYIRLNTSDGDINNCYRWAHSTEDQYPSGIMFSSRDNGSTWEEINNSDFCFKTYKIKGVSPVAINDTYETTSTHTLYIRSPGVLNNDHDPDINPNLFLTASLNTDVSHGALQLNDDGSFIYTPESDFLGTDTFTYTAYDGECHSTNCTVHIKVSDIKRYCIRIEYLPTPSDENQIYHNNLFTTTPNPFCYDENSNIWDNTSSLSIGGNYWSNFNEPSEGAIDIDSNGIIDTPYDVAGDSNSDLYPLLYQYTYAAPFVDFAWAPTNPVRHEAVFFTDLSNDTNYGFIVEWYWDFGDGDNSTDQHPRNEFDTIGVYNVTLTVTDDDGAKASITKQITVMQSPPVALFSYMPLNPTIYDMINFTDQSFDNDGIIVNWSWDFGDGNISYIQHPTHQYSNEDNFTVCLTVIDDNASIDTICHNITIVPIGNIDVNQSISDRGFPIRMSLDGNWAGAQNFTSSLSTLTSAEIYLRSFGMPEFDMVVELREDHPQGTLVDSLVFTPAEVSTSWGWFNLDFADTAVTPGTEYFIVIPPAPSGVTSSFGYEWGYAFGDQYPDGAFWFTRDGGVLWRDLPTAYDFTIRIYGLI